MLWSGFYMGIQIQGLIISQQELYPLVHLPSSGVVLQHTDFPFGPNPLSLWHCDDFTFDSAAPDVPVARPCNFGQFELHDLQRTSLLVSKLGKVS